MKLPQKVYDAVLAEAQKYARFSWYSGWEKSSGYIKSELSGQCRYGNVRIYIKWEKKKEPTADQIRAEIVKHIDDLLENREHHSTQKDFTHYLLETYYVDTKRLEREAMMSLLNALPLVISILEKSDDFVEPKIQSLHNDLKNWECGVNDHEAISEFLEKGRKRIGES